MILRELDRRGFVEGRNLTVEFRGSDGRTDLYPQHATELVGLGVSAIYAGGGELAARAAQAATRSIPIVVFVDDAVGASLVTSLARPGGNITGVSLLAAELDSKRLALLGEAVPRGATIAVLGYSARTTVPFDELKSVAASRDQTLVMVQVTPPTRSPPPSVLPEHREPKASPSWRPRPCSGTHR